MLHQDRNYTFQIRKNGCSKIEFGSFPYQKYKFGSFYDEYHFVKLSERRILFYFIKFTYNKIFILELNENNCHV